MTAINSHIQVGEIISPLANILSRSERQYILRGFWSCDDALPYTIEHFGAYFDYYEAQCRDQLQTKHVIRSHSDLVTLAHHIKNNFSTPLKELRRLIQQECGFEDDRDRLTNSIELAARLWLMVNLRNPRSEDFRTLQAALVWPDTSSIDDVLRQYILRPSVPSTSHPKTFTEDFNAFELTRIGGFRIEWTDNISSHLEIEGQVIYLYYHVSVLQLMKNSSLR